MNTTLPFASCSKQLPHPAHLRCDSRCFASALLEQYGGRRPPVPPPPGEGERKRSRGAPLRPSYERPRHVTLRNRHHRTLIRWSMLSYSRQMPVGAFARAASATARTNGKNERKRFGGETPTDATVVRVPKRARPRLHTGGAHLSAFHHGSCLGDRTPPLSFSPRYLGWGP